MSTARVVVGVGAGVITVAAVLGSLISGSWLILVAWFVLALAIAALIRAMPGGATTIRDEAGNLVTCPNCGGTDFFPGRSATGLTAGFLIFGWLGALLAPRSRIRCASCDATYPRRP